MKKALIVLLSLVTVAAFGQYDKKAKEILDKTSANTKSYGTIKVDFLYIHAKVDDKKKDVKPGTLLLKGAKYRLDLMGNTIISDSKTIWSYVKENNEVNISNVADHEESLFNPAKLFTMYEKGFKYKFIKEKFEKTHAVYELELYPEKVADSEYSKIRLLIDKDKMQIFQVGYFAKDGNQVTIEIQKLTTNGPVEEKNFTFDKAAYPKVEVVDMR